MFFAGIRAKSGTNVASLKNMNIFFKEKNNYFK